MAVHLKALLEKTQLIQPNEVENQICPVCYEDYLQPPSREFPRKLPCGHVIGTECLLLWASSQTHATSINCPWCTHPITHSIDTQYLRTVIDAYAEAALQHIAAQIERAIVAVDRALTHGCWSLLSLAVVFLSLGLYFDGFFDCLPLGFLYVCTGLAVKCCLTSYPRLGVALMVLGFYVGTFVDSDLGHVLLRYGKAPFHAAIARAYFDHTRLVLGLSVTLLVAQAAWGNPIGQVIAFKAELPGLPEMVVDGGSTAKDIRVMKRKSAEEKRKRMEGYELGWTGRKSVNSDMEET
ncbi:hypothetical protein HO133_002430 [Letharia lupina]|uniref:RING-type domain-containing protein n=1 Tax=Letharia lupina TaxID=560253 RepID=A0A8H6CE55_9LECA|nr:uncharacterized protein HO133_002430 [Letharia lupina]KAF6221574.1 hypothetical protein HO133_002430 [Letharia lupina]